MASLKFKRGDTITVLGVRTDDGGQPVNLSGVTITSQMKKNQSTQAISTATLGGGSGGEFRLSISASDSFGLSVGDWLCDVKFADGGVFTTETFTVHISERITDAS